MTRSSGAFSIDVTVHSRAPEGVSLSPGAAAPAATQPTAKTAETATFAQTCFNCASLLLGLSLLASPYAIQKAGWSVTLLGLVLIPGVYFFSAILLSRCMDRHRDLTSYVDISGRAYGRAGLLVFSVVFYLEIFATLIGYAVAIGDNLVQLFPHSTGVGALQRRPFLTLLAGLVILPTAWLRDMGALSLTSVLSLLSMGVVMLSLVIAALSHQVHFSNSLQIVHAQWLPVSSSIFLFCYSGHVVVPSIYATMRDRTKFTKAITFSFSLAVLCYGGLGILGALIFGDQIKSQVNLNLPFKYPISKIATWMTILVPITKFALVLSPLSNAMDGLLRQFLPSKVHLVVASTIMRSIATACIFAIALLFPYFGYVLAIIGASLSVLLCVIFPCLFYIKIMGDKLSMWQVLGLVVIVMLGVITGVTCTIFSIMSYIENHHAQ